MNQNIANPTLATPQSKGPPAPTITWRYNVHVRGIKKRGKTDRFHGDSLGFETSAPDQEAAERAARAWVTKNMKTCSEVLVTACRWEILPDGIESWHPFTEGHNLQWKVEL